ncbi:MAG: hypothetical protein K1X51_08135 [Rhodospirillaceae bacterium]|nr:hypothetical protein [Rhodospirillaceae bacterium]
MHEPDARGYRGYITSQPVNGTVYPHKVQNLVVRDYCKRKGLPYLLSATEGSILGSFMMLNAVLEEAPALRGIVLFSQFMLPRQRAARAKIYERVNVAGIELHAALEEVAITGPGEIAVFDAPLVITPWLPATPFGGRFPVSGPDKAGFR